MPSPRVTKLPIGDQALRSIEQAPPTLLPFHGQVVSEKGFSFSFACFDRTHKLFNLGDLSDSGTLPANWYIDLLDCLKGINNIDIPSMRGSTYDLHPVDWDKANASEPPSETQCEYWQFRINKSKGRVIGFKIDGVFYIVWLDPHHNLTDSDGYGRAKAYRAGPSLYELTQAELESLREENTRLKRENKSLEEWFDSIT